MFSEYFSNLIIVLFMIFYKLSIIRLIFQSFIFYYLFC